MSELRNILKDRIEMKEQVDQDLMDNMTGEEKELSQNIKEMSLLLKQSQLDPLIVPSEEPIEVFSTEDMISQKFSSFFSEEQFKESDNGLIYYKNSSYPVNETSYGLLNALDSSSRIYFRQKFDDLLAFQELNEEEEDEVHKNDNHEQSIDSSERREDRKTIPFSLFFLFLSGLQENLSQELVKKAWIRRLQSLSRDASLVDFVYVIFYINKLLKS